MKKVFSGRYTQFLPLHLTSQSLPASQLYQIACFVDNKGQDILSIVLKMGSSNNFVGDKRYPFGQNMKTERTIYEPPPPPPKPGEYPRKPQYWNLTATKVGKDINSGVALAVVAVAAFGAVIIYYGDAKMNRFMKHLSKFY